MNQLPRPTVQELIVRYDLEPSLKDIFVEGVFDREILNQLISRVGAEGRTIYEIDAIDVPAELLHAHGMTDGNKQRVLALARELSQVEKICLYRCLVDRDFDHWVGELPMVPRLLWTKYCSIESYFLIEKLVKEFLVAVCKCRIGDWESFYLGFLENLRIFYALRLAAIQLNLNMRWLSYERCLVVDGSRVEFDRGDFISRLLAENRMRGRREDYDVAVEAALIRLVGEPRAFVRGHDFIDLMAWIVRSMGGVRSFASKEALERLLILAVDQSDDLAELLELG